MSANALPSITSDSSAAGHRPAQRIDEALKAAGWLLQAEPWSEALQLELSDALLERWLRSEGAYHRQVAPRLGSTGWQQLERLLRRFRGQTLPQPLDHTLLRGRRSS